MERGEYRLAGQPGAGGTGADGGPVARLPRRHLLIALGDTRLEEALLGPLEELEEFTSEVFMHAHDVRARLDRLADEPDVAAFDAVLLSGDLPGFQGDLLATLARHDLTARTVLLAWAPEARAERELSQEVGAVLAPDASIAAVRYALLAVSRRGRGRPQPPAAGEEAAPPAAESDTGHPFSTLAIVSGAGSPGRSTLAVGLAAALGARAPTILVDGDLAGPSAAALVGVDPRRNIFQVAYMQPETPQEWDAELARNVQRLDPRSPFGWVLCGMITRRMSAGVAPDFYARLLAELRARYRHVVIDLGADLTGTDATLHRVALDEADQVILVAGPDPEGLSRAQVALFELEGPRLRVPPERITVVVNRHDRRRHHRRAEIEYALGLPLAALIPNDYAGVERARGWQRPVVVYRGSRAGRAIMQLARRVAGGRIRLAPEPRQSLSARFRVRFRREPKSPTPATDGHEPQRGGRRAPLAMTPEGREQAS